ncbi:MULTISPECIES: hypothetical protein [unclassified Serratia (in: enterobacteria)]|uniref:hypothetical protein n=1 Tax=unclassified Serratia (in: enterobacteria) TaxID=2647522 RepID=UPI00046899F1|nr:MULTISPECIES: hypothetical protein [unclassified Serratia (in: enterobacteria)]
MKKFLLTYTVRPVSDYSGDIDKADKVRNKIAEIEEWFKYSTVETTFMGEAYITGDTDQAKKRNAIKHVETLFVPILEKFEASENDVVIDCVMMVHNIEKPFQFEVKH